MPKGELTVRTPTTVIPFVLIIVKIEQIIQIENQTKVYLIRNIKTGQIIDIYA